MKLMTNKKGQIRVIEAFFASVLLLSCLALIPAQTPSQHSEVNIGWKAQNVLLALDSDGHLAHLVDSHDWAGLEKNVESTLPLTTWFNLTVYDKNLNVLNPYQISNGGRNQRQNRFRRLRLREPRQYLCGLCFAVAVGGGGLAWGNAVSGGLSLVKY